MTPEEGLLIYATGSDTPIREACVRLLEDGTARDVDLLEQGSLYLAPDGKRRYGLMGRAMVLVIARDRLAHAMHVLRSAGEDVRAYAMPLAAVL